MVGLHMQHGEGGGHMGLTLMKLLYSLLWVMGEVYNNEWAHYSLYLYVCLS